jgi:hypothetical protein
MSGTYISCHISGDKSWGDGIHTNVVRGPLGSKASRKLVYASCMAAQITGEAIFRKLITRAMFSLGWATQIRSISEMNLVYLLRWRKVRPLSRQLSLKWRRC